MTYSDFLARWQASGGAEHANYGLFLQDLCDLLGVPRPDPTTDDPAQDAYVFERGVTFDNGAGKRGTGRIDLYKRGCFVLETKQGTDTPDQQALAAKAELGQAASKRRKGHAVRSTALAQQMQVVVQQAAAPLGAAQVAARFRGSSAKKVQPLLDTLALMSLVRFVEEENRCAA